MAENREVLPRQAERPEKGSRWRHPRLRHVWTVRSSGPKWITLDANYPGKLVETVATESWPMEFGAEWVRA